MKIDEKTAEGQSSYGGKTYYFCSTTCKDTFDRNPERYTKQTQQPAVTK